MEQNDNGNRVVKMAFRIKLSIARDVLLIVASTLLIMDHVLILMGLL